MVPVSGTPDKSVFEDLQTSPRHRSRSILCFRAAAFAVRIGAISTAQT